MAEGGQAESRAKFLKAFANIPDAAREDIVAVIDEKPYTWNAAMFEVKNNTDIGHKIIKQLRGLKII